MQRKIMFRGKAKLLGKYHYGSLLKGTDGKLYIGELICPKEKVDERMSMVGRGQGKQMRQYMAMGFLEVIPKTVGEYTGLKDKNGVEIYEGDKISYEQNNHNASSFVYFEYGTYKYDEYYTQRPLNEKEIEFMWIEVIGDE